jgi:hypothetical protein
MQNVGQGRKEFSVNSCQLSVGKNGQPAVGKNGHQQSANRKEDAINEGSPHPPCSQDLSPDGEVRNPVLAKPSLSEN